MVLSYLDTSREQTEVPASRPRGQLGVIHAGAWKVNSANFASTQFSEVGLVLVCATFLLQRFLAGSSDLHTDVPKGGYGLLSLMPYAPKVFLVRPRAPILFQPLVHPE